MDDLKLFGKTQSDLESLINTVWIFSEDIGMQFGLDKCAMITLMRGKPANDNNFQMPNGEEIRSIESGGSYKYLGILEADQLKHQEMKKKIEAEYIRRIRKVLKSKLNAGNMVKAVNTWAVALVRYAAGIVEWNKLELETLDRKTRKLLTMHGMFHPKSDVDRLYVSREKGGRGLAGIEETVRYEEQSLYCYIEGQMDSIMTAVKESMRKGKDVIAKQLKADQRKMRLEEWKEKVMHGQHLRQTEEFAGPESWQWLKRGRLKKETESMLVAAQDQAIRTNYRRAKVEKEHTSPSCRMCHDKDETVSHLVSECSTDRVQRKARQSSSCSSLGSGQEVPFTPCGKMVYEHRAEPVVENDDVKLLWDFNIQTDKVIEARRPDIVLLKKKEKECLIIDIAIPGDCRAWRKEEEKIQKYNDLAWELRRIWKVKTKVVPIVIGALGTVTTRHRSFLAVLRVEVSFETIQKASLLGTAHILRNVLN
ncbi:uncharacterized protein LOC135153479 [Lytechinus pictus]|uniref:uncharacterized protein LOC135153479 n=1 Tax=Lytechinus pictus TaxID=7653 RepID=UPI0030B9E890